MPARIRRFPSRWRRCRRRCRDCRCRCRRFEAAERVTIPAQIEQGWTPKLHWIMAGTLPAGQTRTYELVLGAARAERVVKATQDDKVLEISMGDSKVMQYHHAMSPAPKGVAKVPESKLPLYDHSAFIHPLWSPKGNVLTDINPPDHLHHMGIWMPWTETKFEGQEGRFLERRRRDRDRPLLQVPGHDHRRGLWRLPVRAGPRGPQDLQGRADDPQGSLGRPRLQRGRAREGLLAGGLPVDAAMRRGPASDPGRIPLRRIRLAGDPAVEGPECRLPDQRGQDPQGRTRHAGPLVRRLRQDRRPVGGRDLLQQPEELPPSRADAAVAGARQLHFL